MHRAEWKRPRHATQVCAVVQVARWDAGYFAAARERVTQREEIAAQSRVWGTYRLLHLRRTTAKRFNLGLIKPDLTGKRPIS